MAATHDSMTTTQAMQRFEWSVRALAQDAAVQVGLYPSFVVVADELALEFDEYHRLLDLTLLDAAQGAAVEALDDALRRMSGTEHADLWTIEALERAPEWHRIRALAHELLRVMGWPPRRRRSTAARSTSAAGELRVIRSRRWDDCRPSAL